MIISTVIIANVHYPTTHSVMDLKLLYPPPSSSRNSCDALYSILSTPHFPTSNCAFFYLKKTLFVKMQIKTHFPADPPMPNATVIYDNAERGDGGDVLMEECNTANPDPQLGEPTFYGPIPVYDNPFVEQMGGGAAKCSKSSDPVPWNFWHHVPLTSLGANTPESRNFAHRHAQMVLSPSQPSTLQDAQNLGVNFFDGLDDKVLASLAYDHSSSFSSLEDEHSQACSASVKQCAKQVSAPDDEVAPAKAAKDTTPPIDVDVNTTPASHSLLEDFFLAGGFEPLVIPSGVSILHAPNAATTFTPTLSDSDTTDPFLQELATSPSKAPQKTSSRDHPSTPPSKPSSQKTSSEGRPSKTALKQCQRGFMHIDKIFVELADSLGRPVSQVEKWFFLGMKGSRSTSEWNLYQAYFFKHCEEELQRCGRCEDTDSDCWPSFQEKYNDSTEAFLRAALELDHVHHQNETVQQRSRNFQRHCAKLEKINQDGVENRFQTFAIIVGDCLQEDQGLGTIVVTPGLKNFVANWLKLDDASFLGLAKCEAYNVVAERITEDVDPLQLINDLNKTFDSIDAELKHPLTPAAAVEKLDNNDNGCLEDDSNVISSCKKHLIMILKAATEVRKKVPYLEIDSDNDKQIIPPPVNKKDHSGHPLPVSKKQPISKPVYMISSDSEEVAPPPVQQPPPTRHISTVSPDSDFGDFSPMKKNPSSPLLKKCVVIITSDIEDNEVLVDSKKRHKLSPPDASEDPVGSGDDYVHEQEVESESGRTRTPQKHRTRSTNGRGRKGKERAKDRVKESNDASSGPTGARTTRTTTAKNTSAVPSSPGSITTPDIVPQLCVKRTIPLEPGTATTSKAMHRSIGLTKSGNKPTAPAASITPTASSTTSAHTPALSGLPRLDPAPSATAPLADSTPRSVASAEMLPPTSQNLQAACHCSQTGQDLVNSFPAPRLNHSQVPAVSIDSLPHPTPDLHANHPPTSCEGSDHQFLTSHEGHPATSHDNHVSSVLCESCPPASHGNRPPPTSLENCTPPTSLENRPHPALHGNHALPTSHESRSLFASRGSHPPGLYGNSSLPSSHAGHPPPASHENHPPSTSHKSHAPPSSHENCSLQPPLHHPSNGDSLQLNRPATPMPHPPFLENGHYDNEDCYFGQDYEYDAEMYDDRDYPVDSGYMNYAQNAPVAGPMYNLPRPYTTGAPRGNPRYAPHSYPHQGPSGPMRY
ncbi:hypothetical protein C0993_008546 [Termitomyces sp. T159_Od127]|nr:hypothetical protein C0993_008546 [Termitomyces sp. T159_Od127]